MTFYWARRVTRRVRGRLLPSPVAVEPLKRAAQKAGKEREKNETRKKATKVTNDNSETSTSSGLINGAEPLKIALVQMTSSVTLETNVKNIDDAVKEAADGGARYVLTPENSLLMDLDASRVEKVAASAEYQAALQHFYELADSLGVWLHIGSSPVIVDEPGGDEDGGPRLANRSFLIGPNGKLHGRYDKIHMFDVNLPGGETYQESARYRPGTRSAVVDCGFGKIGLTVCYDLRFSSLYRRLAQAGAELISVPAAFTQYTGKAHWHILLRARAIETGCFIAASAQTGAHDTGRATYGHSLLVSPWGEILLDAGDAPGIYFGEVDFSQVNVARKAVPSLTHDRAFEVEPFSARG